MIRWFNLIFLDNYTNFINCGHLKCVNGFVFYLLEMLLSAVQEILVAKVRGGGT